MGGSKRKHLDMDARKAIEDGIGDKLAAREIAGHIDVSQTTVTREVKANRTVKVPKRKHTSALGRGAPASTSAGTPARSAEPARRRRRPGAAGGARP